MRWAGLGALLVVVLAAAWWATRPPPWPKADPNDPDRWVAHGFLPWEREALAEELKRAVRQGLVAGGAIVVVHEGEPILDETYGFADLSTKRPFTSDDRLRVASLSKTMIATTVAILVHQGRLEYDAPIDRWLPEWGAARAGRAGEPCRTPTLRELLVHTAGLVPNTREDPVELPQEDLDAASKRLAARGLWRPPGGRQAYSGEGYVLVARILEVLSEGRRFEDLVRDVLFTPLGMSASGWHDATNTGPIYKREGDQLTVLIEPGPAEPWPEVNPAGDGVSTAHDLARLFAFHERGGLWEGRQLVPAAALQPMYAAPEGGTWAMGLRVHDGDRWGHPGILSHPGASGILAWIDPDCDVAAVVAVQTWIEDSLQARLRMLETLDRACQRRAARGG